MTTKLRTLDNIVIVDYGVKMKVEPTEWDDDGNPIAWSQPFDIRQILIRCGELEAWSETPLELLQAGASLEAEVRPIAEAFCNDLVGMIIKQIESLK